MKLTAFIRNLFGKKRKDCTTDALSALCGMVPGGMYKGVGYIPGDPNKEWVQEEGQGVLCPACRKGYLHYYWQEEYYHYKCDECGYLDDTGMKFSEEIIKQGRIYETTANVGTQNQI